MHLLTSLQEALSAELLAHAGLYRHVDKIKISGVNLMTAETRLPVDREVFCGFQDATCSNGNQEATACSDGVCPIAGCGCAEDPSGVERCGRRTDDLPQLWADAGYRPSRLAAYFSDLWATQLALFPDKDINLMQISRAFPNVSEDGEVVGFANPDHVRALIAGSYSQLPDHFSVLNASLDGDGPPQEICMESYDLGVQQIGFQMVSGLNTWAQLEPALANARDATTPEGAQAISLVEIYDVSLAASLDHLDTIRGYDELFRTRSGLPNDQGETHRVTGLSPGTYHYKIAGTAMTSGACHSGTITVR